jgi:hypothetical protein
MLHNPNVQQCEYKRWSLDEPVPSTSHFHDLLPNEPSYCYPLMSFLVLQVVVFREDSPLTFWLHNLPSLSLVKSSALCYRFHCPSSIRWPKVPCYSILCVLTSSFLGQNVYLSTLFWHTCDLCSLRSKGHISHPYTTISKVIGSLVFWKVQMIHFVNWIYLSVNSIMNVISWHVNFETTSDHFVTRTYCYIIVTAFAVPLSKLWHRLTWQPACLLFEVASQQDLCKFVHPCRKDNSMLGNTVLSTQVRPNNLWDIQPNWPGVWTDSVFFKGLLGCVCYMCEKRLGSCGATCGVRALWWVGLLYEFLFSSTISEPRFEFHSVSSIDMDE